MFANGLLHNGASIQIAEIIDRYFSLNAMYVKVRTEDNRIAVLRHIPEYDQWTISLVPIREGDTVVTVVEAPVGNTAWATSMKEKLALLRQRHNNSTEDRTQTTEAEDSNPAV
jgi:hypothetical protein